jgi:hypothetical protein
VVGSKAAGLLKMIKNKQTLTCMLGRRPAAEWKQAGKRKVSMEQEKVSWTYEKFVDQKWRDSFNIGNRHFSTECQSGDEEAVNRRIQEDHRHQGGDGRCVGQRQESSSKSVNSHNFWVANSHNFWVANSHNF